MNKEIIEMIQSSPELLNQLLEIKHQGQTEGWTEDAFLLKGQQAFQAAGHEISREDLLDLIASQSGKTELSDDELTSVSGGACIPDQRTLMEINLRCKLPGVI